MLNARPFNAQNGKLHLWFTPWGRLLTVVGNSVPVKMFSKQNLPRHLRDQHQTETSFANYLKGT